MSQRIPNPKDFNVIDKWPNDVPPFEGTPDVTVVTVVFNAVKSGRKREFIRCLDSVQTQRGCRIEHLIVDGASKDGTAEIIAGYENSSVPIRYLSQADHGIYEAMNRGIALARGKYIVYLNSDDRFCNPRGMAASVEALESSRADFSYAAAHVVDAAGRPVEHVFEVADESRNMFSGMTLCHQTILIRREAMVAADGFDLAYRSAADYDLFLRIIYAGCRGVRVEENFVEFLSGGFSSVNASLSEDEVDKIFQCRLHERFGSAFSAPVVRRMRETMEYPVDLTGKILALGEATFGKKLRSDRLQSPKWDRGVTWRFGQELADYIFGRFDPKFLPEGDFRRVLQCVLFAFVHPVHAVGAIKASRVHCDERKPLHDWMRIRCLFIAERKLESYRVVYPCDLAADGDAMRKCARGFVCTNVMRISIPRAEGKLFARMRLLLYSCAYQEGTKTAEVWTNGTMRGRVTLEPTMCACWGNLALPRLVAGSDNATIEVRLVGGGEFVFGGIALCPEA